MENGHPSRKLAVILHADVVDSTALVQSNETVAHECIQATFHSLSKTINAYGGVAHEIRGDALVAEFSRASDAVSAALKFQTDNSELKLRHRDEVRASIRIGISLGEVVIADGTVTGAGVVLAQRLEQLAEPGGVVVQGSVSETVPVRMPFVFESLGEPLLKGFDNPTRAFSVSFKADEIFPIPETELSFPIVEKDNHKNYFKKGLDRYEDFGTKTIELISNRPRGIYTYGPGYLGDLIGMLSGPKTFLQSIELNTPSSMTRALIFYLLCLATTFILELPFISIGSEIWITFLQKVIFFVIASIISAVLYKSAFRLFGGRGNFSHHLIITFYVLGTGGVIWTFLAAVSKGLVLTNNPELYPLFKQLMDAQISLGGDILKLEKFEPLFNTSPVLIAVVFSQLIIVVACLWPIMCWGSYRYINEVSRLQSFFAYIVAFLLSIPIGIIVTTAQKGLGVDLF